MRNHGYFHHFNYIFLINKLQSFLNFTRSIYSLLVDLAAMEDTGVPSCKFQTEKQKT